MTRILPRKRCSYRMTLSASGPRNTSGATATVALNTVSGIAEEVFPKINQINAPKGVVTPVYNGAAFLRNCIESVLKQTYENYEYIIVNNCSTDRTLDIALSYAQQDSRIRIHQNDTFVGVIENHNLAFSLISPLSK